MRILFLLLRQFWVPFSYLILVILGCMMLHQNHEEGHIWDCSEI